jgi:hypothetical protein
MGRTAEEIETLFKKVISDIEQGASLRSAIKKNKPLSATTFTKWCDNDASRAERYARATLKRAEVIFEDIINIADENHRDVYIDPESGVERTDNDVVQRARLRIDARKWVLSKMHPTKYGDKLDVTSGNKPLAVPAIVGMVIKNETTTPDESEPDDDNLD